MKYYGASVTAPIEADCLQELAANLLFLLLAMFAPSHMVILLGTAALEPKSGRPQA
jgi:hypothetical protein